MNRIPNLISTIRKLKNIKQATLAKKAGISQPSLSQFEQFQTTPSTKTVHKLIKALDLNPECLNDEKAPLYKSSILHKMFISSQRLLGFDYATIEHLLKINRNLEFTFIFTTIRETEPHKMISKIIITEFVYAILIRDQNNTIYLIQYKKKNVPLPNKSILQTLIKNIAETFGTNITFYDDINEATFIKKINDSTIKKDFEKILNKNKKNNQNIDNDEERLINFIKQNQINCNYL